MSEEMTVFSPAAFVIRDRFLKEDRRAGPKERKIKTADFIRNQPLLVVRIPLSVSYGMQFFRDCNPENRFVKLHTGLILRRNKQRRKR